jgi:hypothetical protein
MASAPGNISGIWDCDDQGRYYIAQTPDGTVTWAGLDTPMASTSPPLFYRGTDFANVFQGRWSDDGATVSGGWADVPRGRTEGYGLLTFRVSWENEQLVLQRVDAQTTGGFGGSYWTKTGWPLEEPDIAQAARLVHRFDGMLDENNPPCRDFTVMWGEVIDVGLPSLPPEPTYCSFLKSSSWFPGVGWGGDGDISFSFWPAWKGEEFPFGTDADDFWANGWVTDLPNPFSEPRATKIQVLYETYKRFHAEAVMYGRSNGEDACEAFPPHVLVPGWNERGGNSVLVNGVPVEGEFFPIADDADPPDQKRQKIVFKGRTGVPGEITLQAGTFVRISGVVAADVGHHSIFGTVKSGAPEIHPVYSADIPQDFDLPRPFPVLSGAWHASDNGTYYVRQLGDTVWWLGLSRDQGYTYANVFKGAIREGGVTGAWVSVPMAPLSPFMYGELILEGDETGTQLVKTSESPGEQSRTGLGVSWWNKLYDAPGIPAGRQIGPSIGAARE